MAEDSPMDSVACTAAEALSGAVADNPGSPRPNAGLTPLVVNPPDHCGLRDLRELVHEIDTLIASARSQSRTLAVLLARRSESPESAEAPAAHPAPAAQRTPRHPDLPLLLAARLGLACHADEVPGTGAPDEMVMLTGLLPVGRPVEAHLYQRAMALRDTLQGPAWMGGSTVVPQVDLGIAVYPLDGYTGATLLQAARLAAGGAARQGGVAFHDPLANLAAQRQWQLGLALQKAIGKGELRLLYQPKLSLHSGAIEGVEALLRWRTADFGEVPAAEFIPLAERHGCMQAISDWTLHQACQQARAWQQAGLPRVRIGVNVSQMQLRLGDLAQQVQAALLRTGADPAALGIEITEDSLMADIDKATRALRELKALGVEISLDDFGTGSSSLGALQRLPLDVVNVDRSFIHDVTASSESVSMTRAIITMAHGMQLRVLAEGVETEGQIGVLAARGCDLVQGHWFSPAVAPEQIEALLREDRRLPPHLLRQRQRQRTLLLVDDEANILAALKRLLRRDGYQIITADGGEQGLQRLAEHPVDVIVSDQRMPGMSGVEFLRRAKALRPDTVRMTLSGFTELQSIIDAVNEGAIYKFLTKPWDDTLLRQHIADAFRDKELADDNKRLSQELAHANAELEALSVRLASALQAQREQSDLLAASASGAREVLDELPVAVLGIDPDGVVAYVNRAASELLPQALGAVGSVADEIFPQLLGCALPVSHEPVDLLIGGRPYRAMSQAMAGTTDSTLGRGCLVMLVQGHCTDDRDGTAAELRP